MAQFPDDIIVMDDDQIVDLTGESGDKWGKWNSKKVPAATIAAWEMTVPGGEFPEDGHSQSSSVEMEDCEAEKEVTSTLDKERGPVTSPTSTTARVIQCIKLPQVVSGDQFVNLIVPTPSGRHVIVVTCPKSCDPKVHRAARFDGEETDGEDDMNSLVDSGSSVMTSSEPDTGGCVLVYAAQVVGDQVRLAESPCRQYVLENSADAVQDLIVLPNELVNVGEDDGLRLPVPNGAATQHNIQTQVASVSLLHYH